MKVTLAGPDDLGYWVLHDENGNAFPLVKRDEDHPAAARLFGWAPTEGTDEVEDARLWLLDHIGDEIEAPLAAVAYFRELESEE
jgi:hypothetical protein